VVWRECSPAMEAGVVEVGGGRGRGGATFR